MVNRTHTSTLKPTNPIDHLRLLWWFFLDPESLRDYRRRMGFESVRQVGAWLTSTLMWLPILTLLLAIQSGRLPVLNTHFPIWLLAGGVFLGWASTGVMGAREERRTTEWRAAFGEVFNSAFIIVFGVAFGIAFGMAFIVGLDIAEIVSFGSVFGVVNVVALVVIFGVAFGLSFIVADQVAFGGIFVVAPVLALMFGSIFIFGIAFVGAFFAMFIVIFGMAFVGAFILAFILVQFITNPIERRTNSGLERAFRVLGLIVLVTAHVALIWLTLLNGWRTLV